MVRKDVGIILKSARSGETSKLVTFLGRRSGKVNLIGKGAFGAKSPFRGSLELGNVIEAVYYYKEGRTLFFLKEVYVRSTLGGARESLPHLAVSLGLLELVEHICYWGSPEEQVVDLLHENLLCPLAADPLHFYLVFEFKLLGILGVVPDFSSCVSCNGDITQGSYHPADGTSVCRTHDFDSPHRVRLSREILEHIAVIQACSLGEASNLEVKPALRKRLGEILHWTYTFHVQGYSLSKALKLVPKGD
jgi:DNA repair protein RecO (recombination protein O)